MKHREHVNIIFLNEARSNVLVWYSCVCVYIICRFLQVQILIRGCSSGVRRIHLQ